MRTHKRRVKRLKKKRNKKRDTLKVNRNVNKHQNMKRKFANQHRNSPKSKIIISKNSHKKIFMKQFENTYQFKRSNRINLIVSI